MRAVEVISARRTGFLCLQAVTIDAVAAHRGKALLGSVTCRLIAQCLQQTDAGPMLSRHEQHHLLQGTCLPVHKCKVIVG